MGPCLDEKAPTAMEAVLGRRHIPLVAKPLHDLGSMPQPLADAFYRGVGPAVGARTEGVRAGSLPAAHRLMA